MGTPNPDVFDNLLSDEIKPDPEIADIYAKYQQSEEGVDFDRIEQSILNADGAEWDFGRS